MPLYNDSGLSEQEHALPLPGPALVIDVCSVAHNGIDLLRFLATELEDLTEKMSRKRVPQWRFLTKCINLLTLTPSGTDNAFSAFESHVPLIGTRYFDVEVYNGRTLRMQSKEELTRYLVERHIDIVRNSRIQAIQDRDLPGQPTNGRGGSPEQSTVRVFFLVDLKEEESFMLAAHVASWLKEWEGENYSPVRSGRAQRIEVVAICMNAAPQRQYDLLTQLDAVALDIVILLQAYRDDEGYIDEQAQVSQIALMLYTLLLRWPDCFEPEFEDTTEESSGVMQILRRPTYLMGISSLEASVRWGARWLDYNLVAKMIESLNDRRQVQREEQQFLLDMHVSEWLERLKKEIQKVVPSTVQKQLSSLGALEQLQRLTANPGRKHGAPDDLLQNFKQFCEQISELYTNDPFRSTGGVTLEHAIRSAILIPSQLKHLYEKVTEQEENVKSSVVDAYIALLDQKAQMQAFPQNAKDAIQGHGAIPRARHQIAALARRVQLIKQTLPNPIDYRREFDEEASKAQIELERLLRARGWSFWRRKMLQREVEKLYGSLCTCVRRHLSKVSEAIATQVTLTLLEQAGLYESSGQASPYQRQVERLGKGLNLAREQAMHQSTLAEERLHFGLIESMSAFSRPQQAFHLTCRKDILELRSIQDQFLRFYEELPKSQRFNDLARMLIRFSASETALLAGKVLQSRKMPAMIDDQEHFQLLQTELVASLLLANTGDVDLARIRQLLTEYAQAKRHVHMEPSLLDGDVLNIEDAMRETMLAQALSSNKSIGPAEKHVPTSEVVLAAWIGNERMRVPALSRIFDDRSVLARIEERKNTLAEVLEELFQQNKLVGYRDERTGEDYFYLFYPQGETRETLQQVLAFTHHEPLHYIPFPDTEKLIYLHIHRIRQV